MSDFTISPLAVPAALDADGGADFIVTQALINRVMEETLGSNDFSRTAEARLPYALDPSRAHAEFVARVGDEIVGWGLYEANQGDGVTECWLEISVDAAHRRSGIGTAILGRLVEVADRDGRSQLLSHVFARENVSGPRVEPASGMGSLPARDTGVAFALVNSFDLEQVGLMNRLTLPVSPAVFAERVEFAHSGHGDDYEILHWSRATPEEHLEGIARLFTEMSTADPHGDVEISEDVWDADRIRDSDEREKASPNTKLTGAARHIASGELVAFTTLDVPTEADKAVNQWATLVSAGHRGRRLGLAVKLENLRQLMDDFPGHPSIITVNAEENEHMIAVNRSVGFVTVGHGGMFRRIQD